MKKNTNTARGLSLLLALLLTLSALTGCSDSGKASGTPASAKSITLAVVHGDGSTKDFTIETEAETLREALEQEKLIEGEESEYGLFVKTVDGETAEGKDWWCLTKDGVMAETGVDGVKINDGDAYEFTLTEGT